MKQKKIRDAMNADQPGWGDQYTDEELVGYRIEGDMVTRPAPDDEPRRYNARTNTGGRQFVCWA